MMQKIKKYSRKILNSKLSQCLIIVLLSLSISDCKSITVNHRITPPGIVIFSFDDGPGSETLPLLEVLEKYNIRGCFSLLGINAEHHPDLVKRIAAGGHRIINHGYGEKWAIRLNDEAFSANLLDGEKAINAALNSAAAELSFLIYRPHGGFYRKKHRKFWEHQGYRMAPCTIRIYDTRLSETDREKAIMRIIRKIESQNGGILLLHDVKNAYKTAEKHLALYPQGNYNRSWIPSVIEEIIQILQEKGYRMSGFDPAEIPGVIK